MTVPQAFALALQHHQAGRLAEAEALYRQILTVQPDHADARHFFGVIAHQMGHHDIAVEQIHQALALAPNNPAVHSNLGAALVKQGRLDEAIAAHRRALELKPDYPEAHHNLGIALKERGQFEEAVTAFRRALELKPELTETYHNLGDALVEQGQFNEAVAVYRRLLELKPNDPTIHNNLGAALARLRQFDEAIPAFRRALALQADFADAAHSLGHALRERGRFAEAAVAYRRAVQLKPGDSEAHNNLANVLWECGQFDEAAMICRRALELRPDYPEAYYNLGGIMAGQGKLDETVAAFRRALELKPDYAAAHHSLICILLFHPDRDDQAIATQHQHWSLQFAEPLRALHRPHANDRDPERRLRIGYVSPNFHRHPIANFFTPLLEAHDKARVELYCYAGVKCPDTFTERMKKTADVWCDALGFADQDLAERIRADQIDILVDLTQHMEGDRLLVFARKPAPVQVSWLGYPASTGLPEMDYRFTDRFLEPEGAAWSESVEIPVRLPDCWFCFDPLESPEPIPPPALRTGQITFGSLNHFYKINETVLQLWVALLQAVEGSRLLLHCAAGDTQTRLRQWFEARGIAPGRLDLVSRTANRMEYLQLYQRIDIGLDPFPYNGGTTTCEALWMGVPIVSLAGRTAVARIGLSALTNLGTPEWVAHSADEYLGIAASLARDLPRLAELRATLRPRMQASPLMDAPRFARNIETAYRAMWRQWCASHPS